MYIQKQWPDNSILAKSTERIKPQIEYQNRVNVI